MSVSSPEQIFPLCLLSAWPQGDACPCASAVPADPEPGRSSGVHDRSVQCRERKQRVREGSGGPPRGGSSCEESGPREALGPGVHAEGEASATWTPEARGGHVQGGRGRLGRAWRPGHSAGRGKRVERQLRAGRPRHSDLWSPLSTKLKQIRAEAERKFHVSGPRAAKVTLLQVMAKQAVGLG